ncbi:MAG: glycosyltransferase [Roseburia sp.]|nr:glycosyltransferase [Roseburia sp.]
MRIIQILPTISFGDAVGNDVLTLKKLLEEHGFSVEIYAENIDPRLPQGTAKNISEFQERPEDIILYHLAIGTRLNEWIRTVRCRKIMRYHNITPYHFFDGYCAVTLEACQNGQEQMKKLQDTFELVLADSEFNKKDLEKAGYRCPIIVLPILIPFEDYLKKPNRSVVERYKDDFVNLAFIGRIAPNKCQQDIIHAFYLYHKYYNPKSRLFLVGSYTGMERYYQRLLDYTKRLGAKDVIFTGHIKFDEILAYYKLSDVFVCMSEHEGFCVPLVEAMYFNVPILAYDACAVKDTLGGGGLLLKDKSALESAALIDHLIQHEKLRDEIIENQRERLMDFSYEMIGNQFLKIIKDFIKER